MLNYSKEQQREEKLWGLFQKREWHISIFWKDENGNDRKTHFHKNSEYEIDIALDKIKKELAKKGIKISYVEYPQPKKEAAH